MIDEIIKNVQDKLGENASLITDDIANLYKFESDMQEKVSKQESDINELKNRNDTLTSVNANLLKSVSFSTNNEKPTLEETEFEEPKEVSFKDCFDSKGNFIR